MLATGLLLFTVEQSNYWPGSNKKKIREQTGSACVFMQIERTKGIHPSYLCRDLYLYPLIYGLCNIIYIYTFYPGMWAN